MAFNILDIKAGLQYGGARPTLFKVNIFNPMVPAADLKVPLMVRATTIPASDLGTIQIPYFGRKIKVAGDRTFAPWSVTVMNDEDFIIRNAMEQWSHAINTHISNRNIVSGGVARSGGPENYKSDATITQYSKTGQIVRSYQFIGLYPETISTIDMDWNATDQIEEFQVTFQYDSFVVTGGDTGLIVDGSSPVSEI
jgi:hypothetical protein